LAPGP